MKALWLSSLILLSLSAQANADTTTSRTQEEMWAAKLGCGNSQVGSQRVYAYFNGASLDSWNADPAAMHQEKLPDGSNIGVKIEPVPASYYARTPFRDMHYAAELVKVSLFDMSHGTPRLLLHNFAGASSTQSYFGDVAPDKPLDLNAAGLTLVLQKASCVPLTASR